MTAIPPLNFRWDGEAMIPRQPKLADRHYVIGQDYMLVEHLERSRASHNHLFAEVHQTFINLPEEMAERFVTEDQLRKYALCKAGCCDVATHACPSRAAAKELTDFLRGQRLGDLVVHDGARVTVLTAWSMNYRAMDRATFQEAKDKVLAVLADLIGVQPHQLGKAA